MLVIITFQEFCYCSHSKLGKYSAPLQEQDFLLSSINLFCLHIGMRNLVKKYEPPRSEEVAVLKQKLERCHSAELALNVIT